MLIRILSDNPGHTFTRNIDAKFVSTIRSLLRNSKDESVQILLRETLEILEAGRSWDEDFSGLLQMWKKEKGRSQKGVSRMTTDQRFEMMFANWFQDKLSPTSSQSPPGIGLHPHLQTAYPIQFTSSTLPPPGEVSARISEAQNSARLLLQLLDSTHPAEVQGHELIREFSDRCRTSSRTIQAYIESTNPAPDEGTLVALIETNDELSVSLSKYSHSILDARKGHGNNANINNSSNSHNNDSNTNVNTNTNTNTTPSTSASASGTGTSNSPARASVSAAPGPSSASASASASASGSHTPEFLIPSAVPAPLLPRRNTSQQSREASHYSGSPNRTHEYDTGSAASTSGKSRAASGVGVGVRPPPSASDDATVAGTSESGRYHYNPEDFQIPNPFAGPGPPGSGEDHT